MLLDIITCTKLTSITWTPKLNDVLKANIWFSAEVTNAIEKKFQLVIHHPKNVVKLAQYHRLSFCELPVGSVSNQSFAPLQSL
jgi:hypothetical protein